MADRGRISAAVTADASFSELTVQRLQSDVDLARSHAMGRNRRVGEFLCCLSLMQSHSLVSKLAGCRVTGAGFQDFSSQAGREAAHYLPGQIVLHLPKRGALMPWELVKNPATREWIGSLFSRVQDLPANFNKADSYSEKYASPSLKQVFALACDQVLSAAAPPAGKVNAMAVRAAYGFWVERSLLAYRSAINRKIDIAELDDLPPAMAPAAHADGTIEPHEFNIGLADLMERSVRKSRSGQPGTTVWDYSEQTRILGHYLRATQGSTLSDRLIQDTAAGFKP